VRTFVMALAIGLLSGLGWNPRVLAAGEDDLVRPAPPALEDFDTDKNNDGVPDIWYNARDVVLVKEGGRVGPQYLRFEVDKPGRPARLSRAFGVDGRQFEAIVIGLWIKTERIQAGERLGEEPGLMIDFLGEGLRALRRGTLGPWTRNNENWTRVAKRIPVSPGTRDAILSLGLLGATGVLDVDGLTIELIPVGGTRSQSLINNGGFELGDPVPDAWILENEAQRAFPGFNSNSSLELSRSGSRALTGLVMPVGNLGSLEVSVMARGQSLRGSGGAGARLFFLTADGVPIQQRGSGVELFRWAGTFDWRIYRNTVPVPPGASQAVFQIDKPDSIGALRVDQVVVTTSPDPSMGSWIPYHVRDDTTGWSPVEPSKEIQAKSALDASYLLDAPAGQHGFVTVKEGRLAFTKGERARFFGVYLLAPAAYLEAQEADELADRLARSGINLVHLGELDTPLGPDRSLFDDNRDDTLVFDQIALSRLDHLLAALKARGIYYALGLQSERRFRSEDGLPTSRGLPPGGGPAAEFDPKMKELALRSALALLDHVNPETKLALKDDPALAWVTLGGEISLFDLIEDPNALPPEYAESLRKIISKGDVGSGRRAWQLIGESHWRELAESLRKNQLRVPIAGVSHWRRNPEFSLQQAAKGLDLVDDRLYWNPTAWTEPQRRSMLWSRDGGLLAGSGQKRKPDRPYVVSQWCSQTQGAWALPYEGADQLLAAWTARSDDWDALVRRGIFLFPRTWGANAAGTGGGEDLFQLPEVINGMPEIYSLWPHAASLFLRGDGDIAKQATRRAASGSSATRGPAYTRVPGWNPAEGRLVIDTPYTKGFAGWSRGEVMNLEELSLSVEPGYGVVVASSVGTEPIATTKRLLVTALARIQPTDLRWIDDSKNAVAEPGKGPLLREPVVASFVWRRKGNVKAYPIDNQGVRGSEISLQSRDGGYELPISAASSTMHWELVVE